MAPPSAGLILGAFAWATSTQLNYALVPWVCTSHVPAIPVIAIVLAAIAIVGVLLSLHAYRQLTTTFQSETPQAGAPHELLALIGMLSGSLFAVIILMQGLASFFLTGCEP
jgi:hypothetical protein